MFDRDSHLIFEAYENARLGTIPTWVSNSLRNKLQIADKAGIGNKIVIHNEWSQLSPQQKQELLAQGWSVDVNRKNQVQIGISQDVGPNRLRKKVTEKQTLKEKLFHKLARIEHEVGMVASYSASLAVKCLIGVEVLAYTYLNLKAPMVETIEIKPAPNCTICGVIEEYDLDTLLPKR